MNGELERLVAADEMGPGMVPPGFAEELLARLEGAPADALWDSATSLAALAQKWNGHGREKNELKSAQMFCEIELGQQSDRDRAAGTSTSAYRVR